MTDTDHDWYARYRREVEKAHAERDWRPIDIPPNAHPVYVNVKTGAMRLVPGAAYEFSSPWFPARKTPANPPLSD